GLVEIADGEAIRLALVAPGMLGGPDDVRKLERVVPEELRLTAQNSVVQDTHDRPGTQVSLKLLHAVPSRDVADLVRKDSRELGPIFRSFDESSGQIDVSARQRKGVHDVRVDDIERVLQIRAATYLADPSTDRLDVGIELGILNDGQVRVDLRRHLIPDFSLPLV